MLKLGEGLLMLRMLRMLKSFLHFRKAKDINNCLK